MKKTTIIFDCIGVIVAAKPIQSWCIDNLGGWDACQDFFHAIARRFDLGEIGDLELFTELGEKVGRSHHAVKAEIDSRYAIDTVLVEYIRELKGKGYKIGLLSNGHHESLEKKLFSKNEGLKELFDSIVVSSEVGMVKPHAPIYEHALKVLRSMPEESIFIDDSAVNIEGAEAVGITGIFYTTAENLKKELESYTI